MLPARAGTQRPCSPGVRGSLPAGMACNYPLGTPAMPWLPFTLHRLIANLVVNSH